MADVLKKQNTQLMKKKTTKLRDSVIRKQSTFAENMEPKGLVGGIK